MSWPRAVALRTDRLVLVPLAVEDASEMVAVLAPPDLYRFTGGEPPTLEALEARYGRQVGGRSEDGSAGWSNWIIRPRDGRPAIGFVQATLAREGAELVADLAWLITVSEQGRGLAGEAASAVVTWLTSTGVERLQAFIHPEHTASAHVARRLGLAPTSTLVDGEILWDAVVTPVQEGREGVR
jgi:RimJ/RimL family protein N-acetyltransferase